MSDFTNIRSVNQLAITVRNDPELQKMMKENPSKILDEISSRQVPDTRVYRIVVSSLGGAVLVALIGAIAITITNSAKEIPDILIAISSAAVGGLAGLLAPQPRDGT